DRARQRRLGDAQPAGRPPEVQLLGHRDEVRQLPGLQPIHTSRVLVPTALIFAGCRGGWSGWGMTMDSKTGDSRIALVTGANKGIGREIVRQLAGLGMTVLL